MQLRIPGPTPLPPKVLQAMNRQMINHRGKEFAEILRQVTGRLQALFQTKNDVFVLTASGTGSMEAAVVNTLSPGDPVLALSNGFFGDRFTDIAVAYGAEVTRLTSDWGQPIDPEAVRRALKQNPRFKAVMVVHNETSTGVTNDLEAIARIVKGEFGKLLVVDAVSSIGSIPLPVDAWQCDVVATASQKGWMAPPGIAMVSVSPAAWEAYKQAKCPRFYFDLGKAKSYLESGQTPWTPAVSILYGLDTALQTMLRDGMDSVFRRHQRVGDACRKGIKRLGLQLFADERYASNTVTAIKVPAGVEWSKLSGMLRTEHKVVLAGGQASLSGKIFRIGHLGYVSEGDIQGVMDALAATLPKVGFAAAGARGS